MAKLYNLARMTTATTGTGTITLGSAVSSYVTFANAGVQNGETVTYAIVDGTNREIGRGVYTSSGTTLTRATILESTNSNNAINLSGSAEVFITAAAEDITSSVEITGGSITGITDLAIADGGTGASTAPNARTNLGLGTIATQAANNVSITGGSVTGITDITVADGGTGVSSFTAYSLIAGGTTSTGALQSISGLGTSGQVLTSNGAGALPTWQAAASSSMTLLGTITTTSGSSLNLTGLDLTTYKSLYISVNSVSSSSATDDLSITDGAGNSILIMTDSNNATHVFSAIILISLEGGGIMVSGQTDASTVYAAGTGNTGSGTAGAKTRFGRVNLTTASTSLGFSVQTGFDAGSITVYGVK